MNSYFEYAKILLKKTYQESHLPKEDNLQATNKASRPDSLFFQCLLLLLFVMFNYQFWSGLFTL